MKSRKDLIAATDLALAAVETKPVNQVGNAPSSAAAPIPPAQPEAPRGSRTAPGTLLAAMGVQRNRDLEVAELRRQLEEWVGSHPTRRIDPELIDETPYANRDPSHYNGPRWEAFKNELRESGGNVQPVLLRPSKDKPGRYEIGFGHRRTRGCRELGVPVLAVILEVEDRDLFLMMERENRNREDLSPYEQGESYRRALASGLYPSQRQLAIAVGRDVGLVGRYITLAELPAPVLDAFPSRTSIQKDWGALLNQAVQRDPDGVMERANGLGSRPAASAKAALTELLGTTTRAAVTERVIATADGRKLGVIRRRGKSAIEVRLETGTPTDALIEKLAAVIEKQVKA
jgi:ParB family transcriptional regulator, chromosome partitioning protein